MKHLKPLLLAVGTLIACTGVSKEVAIGRISAADGGGNLANFGTWSVVNFATSDKPKCLAAHAALMPNGGLSGSRVLYWGGSQNEPQGTTGRTALGADCNELWDPANPTTKPVKVTGPVGVDFYHAGATHLPDGRLLIVGGTDTYPEDVPAHVHQGVNDRSGTKGTYTYDIAAGHTYGTDTLHGRRAPTVIRVMAPAGPAHPIMILSGHPTYLANDHYNYDVQLMGDDPLTTWYDWGFTPAVVSWFARAHLLQDNSVFISSTAYDKNATLNAGGGGPTNPPTTTAGTSDTGEIYTSTSDGTSVILPFRCIPGGPGWCTFSRGTVLLAGGSLPKIKNLQAPYDGTLCSGLSGVPPLPCWKDTGVRTLASTPRLNLNATLLPTGDVFVTGGVGDPSKDGWFSTPDTSVYTSEVYRWYTNTWYTAPAATVSRNANSTALLLPDGSVWTAGGTGNAGFARLNVPGGGDGRELRHEIFKPWYIGNAKRPTLTSVTKIAHRTWSFELTVPDGVSMATCVVMAPGAVTHSFDVDQRMLEVPVQNVVVTSGRLTGNCNWSESSIAQPRGYYLFFIRTDSFGNANGAEIPSNGAWIQPT